MPDADDKKRLLALEELRRREDHENDREKTANSKLTSSLVALPIVISLSTTAFFTVLIYAVRFGLVGGLAAILFVGALIGFIVAAVIAIVGLWPMRAKYQFIGLRTIVRPPADKSYEEFLDKIIQEKTDVVRANGKVNAEKLGMYAMSSMSMVIGLGLLAVVVVIFAIAGFTAPDHLQLPNIAPSASPTIMPQPVASPSVLPRIRSPRP